MAGPPFDRRQALRDTRTVLRGFFAKLRRVARHIPFAEDLVAAYYCAVDRSTPAYVRAVLMGALAYFVIPTDLIPDFLGALGFSDDAAVFLTVLQTVGGNIKDTHREQARAWLAGQGGEPPDATPSPPHTA